MRKIVLYNPQAERIYYKKGHPVLPLMAISSFLDREGGYDIKIYDYIEKEKAIDSAEGATLFGITSMTGYQISDGLSVAKIVKKKYPDVPLVWGGWHPSIFPEQTVQNKFVDIIVRGQGERTFTELVKALESNADLSKIFGITYKRDGKIIANPSRPFENVNNFPPLPYHLIDINSYAARTRLGRRTIGYITSQGCPFYCGFCAEQVIYKRRWSALAPDRVASDMRNLVERYGIDSIIISDSNFFVDEKRVYEICERIKDLHIVWGQVNGRADTLARYKKQTWELMKESGLRYILTGAESGMEDVLDVIKKEAVIQDTFDFSEVAKRYDIRIQFSLMIGVPNPHRNYSIKDEFYGTLGLIYKLHKINRNNEFLLFVYAPYPGSPLYETAKQLGFKEPAKFEEWAVFDLNLKHVPWVPNKYVRLTWDLSYYLFFISGNVNRTINNYPFVLRVSLKAIAVPFYIIALLRFKYKFFLLPFELWVIRSILRIKNILQEIYRAYG